LGIETLGALLTIIAIDLVLSGDNAVVIGMAAQHLPPTQRRKAILWGGIGAIVLRIGFTILAALLLDVPFLQAIGGLLLIWIAIKLLRPFGAESHHVNQADSLGAAIRTIILADAVMSLDNMLAVGGAAHGNLWLLLFGLALSIPILLVGSSIVARFITKYPWLNYVGAAILVHTAMEMFFADEFVDSRVELLWSVEIIIMAFVITGVILYGVFAQRRAAGRRPSAHSPSRPPSMSQEPTDG